MIRVNNDEFYVELIISKAQGKLTRLANNMIKQLADNAIDMKKYRSADDKLDILQTAYLVMYSKWYNFNEEKSGGDCFSYFTEIYKRGSASGFNELYLKRGDPEYQIKMLSIEGSNDGNGLHSV